MTRCNSWWHDHFHLMVAFILPMLILGAVYASFDVYPFGNNSVLVLDLNGQYVSYFEAFRDAFYEGKSLLYSHSRSLSGEMLGLVAYYLASPFSLIVLLLPKVHITEAILLMTLLKIGTASLTMAIYLKRYQLKPLIVVMLSMMYGLSAYSVVQVMNIMWMDGVLALPLLILGVERLVDDGKTMLFTVVLMYLFITNYYIAYMIGLLSFMYYVYYVMMQRCADDDKRQNSNANSSPDSSNSSLNSPNKTFSHVLLFFRQTIIAVLATAWMLIPTAYSLTLGKAEFSQPNTELFSKFDFMNMLVKLLPSTYDSVNIEGLPFIYAGILILVLVPLYFISDRIRLKEKLLSGGFLILLVVLMNVSLLDLAMHGFQNPNWLNYRYSFFVSFFLLMLSAKALQQYHTGLQKKVIQLSLGAAAFVIIVQALDFSFVDDETTIWLALGSMALYGLFWLLATYYPRAKQFEILMLLVLIGELSINAVTSLDALDYEVLYSTRESYVPYMEEIRLPLGKIADDDPGFYRIEKTFHRTVNDPMSLGIRGLSHSSSTLHQGAISLLKKLGFSARDHWTKYLGATPVSDSILGVRYVLTKEIPVPYHELQFRLEDISVYRNQYAMSIGFAASKEVLALDIDSSHPLVLQNALLSSLLGWDYTAFFEEVPVKEIILENVSQSKIAGHECYKEIDESLNAQVEFILEGNGEPIYAYFPSEYEREVNLWIDQEWLDTFFGNESFRVMNLGDAMGDRSLIMTITNREVYLKEDTAFFYRLNQSLFDQAMTELKQGDLQIDQYRESRIRGTVTQNRDGMFFTTLPFEKGWTVLVDGKKVPYYETADALIGFDLPSGDHTIELKFVPYGMRLGALLAVLGLGLWWLVMKNKISIRKKKQMTGQMESMDQPSNIQEHQT